MVAAAGAQEAARSLDPAVDPTTLKRRADCSSEVVKQSSLLVAATCIIEAIPVANSTSNTRMARGEKRLERNLYHLRYRTRTPLFVLSTTLHSLFPGGVKVSITRTRTRTPSGRSDLLNTQSPSMCARFPTYPAISFPDTSHQSSIDTPHDSEYQHFSLALSEALGGELFDFAWWSAAEAHRLVTIVPFLNRPSIFWLPVSRTPIDRGSTSWSRLSESPFSG